MAADSIIALLDSVGFYDFVLPWLLVFTIVYALLEKIKVLNDKKTRGIVAFVIAFFATALGGDYLATFFINFLGGSMIYIVGIVVALIFLALVGGPTAVGEKGIRRWAVILFILALVVALFLGASGVTGYLSFSAELTTIVVALLIIAIVVYFVTSGDDQGQKKPKEETQK
jgi:small-conductance mechanosensitive channel